MLSIKDVINSFNSDMAVSGNKTRIKADSIQKAIKQLNKINPESYWDDISIDEAIYSLYQINKIKNLGHNKSVFIRKNSRCYCY